MAVDIKVVAMGGNPSRCNGGSAVSAASSASVQRGVRVRGPCAAIVCYVCQSNDRFHWRWRGGDCGLGRGRGRGEVARAGRFYRVGPVAPASEVSRGLDERRSGIRAIGGAAPWSVFGSSVGQSTARLFGTRRLLCNRPYGATATRSCHRVCLRKCTAQTGVYTGSKGGWGESETGCASAV